MFILNNSLKNIRRHSHRAVLYLLICAIAVLALQVYIASIDRTRRQLDQLATASDLPAQVVNMDASKTSPLQIREHTVEGLLTSENVRDLNISVVLHATATDASETQRLSPNISIRGINRAEALDGLAKTNVEWLAGWDWSCLAGKDMVCVVNDHFLADWGIVPGDTLTIDMYYNICGQRGGITYGDLGTCSLLVIGSADMAGVEKSPNIVLPLNTAREIFAAAEQTFYASSADFHVKDPMRLNEFKEEMASIWLAHADFSGNSRMAVVANMGAALLMDDAAFIIGATRLQESLELLRAFLPVIVLVLAVIGYFVAYLMVQSRADEYAVLRLLGMGKSRSMGMYFLEMTLLTLTGALVGLLLALVFGIVSSLGSALGIFALFLVCFLLGSLIALRRLSRVNVMLALSRAD